MTLPPPMRLPEAPPPEAVAVGVEACRNDPHFTTYPGATDDEIEAAERALGVEFPPHYRAFLQATNGMSVQRGRTHYFGVGPDAVVDVVEFNDPDGWLSTAPDGWLGPHGVCWIGVGYQQSLNGFHPGPPVSGVSTSLLVRKDCSTYVPFGNAFGRLSEAQKVGMNVDDPAWRSIVKQIDRLELGEGLILGVDHYLHGRDDTRVVRKVRLETALRLAVDLSAELETVDDDVEIFSFLPYVDDQGRARARWMTETEFPNGPPSNVTIDGQVP